VSGVADTAPAPVDLRQVERRALAALASREAVRVLVLWKQTLVASTLTALLYMVIFGGALGARLGRVDGLDYLQFILPGLLTMTVTTQAFGNNATSLLQAKDAGYIEDVLSSPLRPWQLAAGYMTGGLVRAGVAAVALFAVATPFTGFPDHPLVAAAALVLTAVLFSALGVVAGIWAETFDKQAAITNLLIQPLALVGGVFYSATTLAEPWATLTRIDPLYHLVDASRAGFIGINDSPVAGSLLSAAALAALCFAAATRMFQTGWRLKP
jgi:ABC-2 type transport system permease protein